MPARVSYIESMQCVQVEYLDDLSIGQLLGALGDITLALRAHQSTRVLADCSGMVSGPTLIEIYEAVRGLLEVEETPSVRQALVLPSSTRALDVVTFWETASVNRGIDARSFTTRADALAWLTA